MYQPAFTGLSVNHDMHCPFQWSSSFIFLVIHSGHSTPSLYCLSLLQAHHPPTAYDAVSTVHCLLLLVQPPAMADATGPSTPLLSNFPLPPPPPSFWYHGTYQCTMCCHAGAYRIHSDQPMCPISRNTRSWSKYTNVSALPLLTKIFSFPKREKRGTIWRYMNNIFHSFSRFIFYLALQK